MTAEELANLTLEELFQRWPETAVPFHRRQMACVGCAVASFYTVTDAAHTYALDNNELVREILRAIAGAA